MYDLVLVIDSINLFFNLKKKDYAQLVSCHHFWLSLLLISYHFITVDKFIKTAKKISHVLNKNKNQSLYHLLLSDLFSVIVI